MTVLEPQAGTVAPAVAPGRVAGLGHLPRLVRDPFGFLGSLADVGEVVTVLIGRKPVHLITTPRLVRSVLLAGGEVFRRGRVFEKATKTFGGGVIVAEGEAHRRQRRLMQPAFGRHHIASYVPEMRAAVERSVAKWRPGTVLDIPRVTHEMAVDALVHSLFKADLADGAAERIMGAFPGVVSGIMAHTLYPADWMERLPLGVNRRYQKSSDAVREVVDDVITRSAGSDSAGAGLLNVLIQEHQRGAGYDRDLLRDEVVTLLIAGSETVATTLAWVLHEIAGHPEAERALVDELTTELGDVPVQHRDLAKLPLLDQVIKEALRLHTPNWLLTRRATEPTTLGRYRIPAGAEVGFSLTALHRDPRVFEHPLVFDPSRWLDEDLASSAFLPFGVGRHRCPGDTFAWAELGVALATILRDWHLVHRPGAKVRELPMVTVQPSGLRMVARRRSPARP